MVVRCDWFVCGSIGTRHGELWGIMRDRICMRKRDNE